jgi:hypothetical protein
MMIPARNAYRAVFASATRPDDYQAVFAPVEAWSDGGKAMVLNPQGDGLAPVSRFPNFKRVVPDEAPVVGVLPGDGWKVRYTEEDGEAWHVSVMAWTMHTDGTMRPVTASGDTWQEPLREDSRAEMVVPEQYEPVTETEVKE